MKDSVKPAKGKKTVLAVLAGICILVAAAGLIFYITFFPNPFAQKVSPEQISGGSESVTGESDILIAYFSLANNREYLSEEVDAVASASLKIRGETAYGHGELMAIAAQEVTGGDLFPILAEDTYPESYSGAFARHRNEMGSAEVLPLTKHLETLEGYRTIIVIYPNWLSSLPQPVVSFLEEYDFSEKTIIPIATSQALGLGSGPEQIQGACPDAAVSEGLSARSEDGVKDFLTKMGIQQ